MKLGKAMSHLAFAAGIGISLWTTQVSATDVVGAPIATAATGHSRNCIRHFQKFTCNVFRAIIDCFNAHSHTPSTRHQKTCQKYFNDWSHFAATVFFGKL
eukprot:GHVT01009099.1.p1 GENE.GHVT01009099.1~~GHVT01009099.1.p1  ORF type:complete len:100 (+),score=8.65 GHVT01009099.1:300-599(+)